MPSTPPAYDPTEAGHAIVEDARQFGMGLQVTEQRLAKHVLQGKFGRFCGVHQLGIAPKEKAISYPSDVPKAELARAACSALMPRSVSMETR